MRTIAAFAAGLFAAGCSLEQAGAPSLTGPSEFAVSITVKAEPDQLPRDGTSQAVVTITIVDSAGKPVVKTLGVSADIGTVSRTQVLTGSDGRVSFVFTAPAASVPGTAALIQVVPLEGNAENGAARTVTILLTGTVNRTLPTAAFTFSPASPVLRETVAFDASDSTDETVKCNDTCTYAWDFGDGSTGSGRVVTHQFTAVRTYPVKLTVTDNAGATATLTKNVVVAQGTAPTASFLSSPASPQILETVTFNAQASIAGQAGRTITSYEWRFGDGETGTGVTTTHSYSTTGAYSVALTVTDSAGVQATTTATVTVVNSGITALFTLSPAAVVVGQTLYLNAEKTTSRSPIAKYYWNFGASTSVTETTSPLTSTSYDRAGTYTITLTVEDSAGRKASYSTTVVVS